MWLITHRQPIRAVKPKQLAVAFLPLDLSVSDPNTGLVVVRRRKEDAPNKEQLLSRLTSHDIPSWNFTAGCRHLTPVLVSLGWRAAFRRLPASLLVHYRSASHVGDLTPCLLPSTSAGVPWRVCRALLRRRPPRDGKGRTVIQPGRSHNDHRLRRPVLSHCSHFPPI